MGMMKMEEKEDAGTDHGSAKNAGLYRGTL